jgi:predicted HicB family RNase H-like nuclease
MPETVVHFQVRMPPPVHERLASQARASKTSLNALIVTVLQAALARREASADAAAVAADGSSR